MKKYDAILFDLDGTLLPLDYNTFMETYFGLLCRSLAHLGFEHKQLINSIWIGCKAMVKNNGEKLNREVFWEAFEKAMGCDVAEIKKICDGFYTTDFHKARSVTEENPLAKKAVETARRAAGKVILATNPLFPADGQLTRISWIGLDKEDFDLITSYDTDSFCKPNPDYYRSICERMGVSPERCLMIGNDEEEDAVAAMAAGMDAYIVTDHILFGNTFDLNCPRGTFAEMCAYLEELAL